MMAVRAIRVDSDFGTKLWQEHNPAGLNVEQLISLIRSNLMDTESNLVQPMLNSQIHYA